MKAMILAAGKGTRLGKITDSVPKALVDINGKSALKLAVENCNSSGFKEIIINVHHFADLVEIEANELRRSGFRISISDEREELLDTGGGLYKARNFFDTSPFLLYNVDIITDLDLSALYNFHKQSRSLATLAVRQRKGSRFFLVNDSGVLKGWRNKFTNEEILVPGLEEEVYETGFCGLHVIEPEIFGYMTEGVYSMTSLYLKLAASHKISTYRYDEGYWFDVGTPENLQSVRDYLGK